jgi:GxxExxY protein
MCFRGLLFIPPVMAQIIYKEEVYFIVWLCMEVWKTLGYGFAEIIYKDAMEQEFANNAVPYNREDELSVFYKRKKLRHKFVADFILYENIIAEVKSGDDAVIEKSFAQTLNYLKASGFRVGLIINFGKSGVAYKRLVV